jgi:predicted ATPase/DNA-binding XRE family transcriptional regulator
MWADTRRSPVHNYVRRSTQVVGSEWPVTYAALGCGRDTWVTDDAPFAGRLRALREAAGLSQEELAERAGLSSHAISALERGTRTRPYPHTVRALCDALGADANARADLIACVPARTRHASADSSSTFRSLPSPATDLLGRDRDIARVMDLVGEQRVVTLTGMGGVGKTRLALAVATAARDRFADGVAYVELALLRGTDEVLLAIADAVDARVTASIDATSAVVERLRHRRLLLVLDNVEHLLEVAPRIASLMEAAPGVTLLATSRAPLRIRGETEVKVEPLAVPRTGDDLDGPAVKLLLTRADAVSAGWGTAHRDRRAVAALCTRLAGIPLALELAAGRARLLDPDQLLDRLDVALLEGARDLPERQRTMRATLDWSYGLLTVDEQRLLRLLSVFVGGFRLDDVERVVALAGQTPVGDVLTMMEALSEQSLVVNEAGVVGSSRQRLLVPVAQYARDRLTSAGEWESAVTAHTAHFLTLAETLAPRYRDGGQVDALARVDVEHANLTAAIERSLAVGDASTAARLTWALWMYWWLRGHLVLGRRLAESVLEYDLPPGILPRAELAAATMAFALDDVTAALGWWSSALAHAEDDPVTTANAIAGMGLAALARGDLVIAAEAFERARPIAETAGADGEWTRGLSLIWLGTVRLLEGDAQRAVAHIEQGLASARTRGDRLTSYVALYNLSQVEMSRGDHLRAREYLQEGLKLSQQTGDLSNLAYLLDATAVLEAAGGDHSRVPLLFGAAQTIREGIGSRGYGYYRPDPAAAEGATREARGHLGENQYDDSLDVGRRLSPDEATDLALAQPGA